MKLTPEEKQGLSPSEIAALQGEGADAALATMGDQAPPPRHAAADAADADATTDADADEDGDDGDDGDQDDATSANAADTDSKTAKPAGDGTLTAEQLAAIARDTGAEPAKLPTFEVPERDFAAERKALRDSRKEIQAKWDSGDLSDEELQIQLDAVDDKLENLAAERARADTLRAINEQAARDAAARIEAEENEATVAIIKAAAASTTAKVDYLQDKSAQVQFDMALGMLKADEANARKTPTQLVQEAHRAVLAIRGLSEGGNTPAPTPTPAPRQPRNVPLTLSGLPNASQVPLQDDTMAQAAQLSGDELEAFMARLSPAQLNRLMRTVDGARH